MKNNTKTVKVKLYVEGELYFDNSTSEEEINNIINSQFSGLITIPQKGIDEKLIDWEIPLHCEVKKLT